MVAGLLVRLAQAMAETGNMARSEYLFNEAEKIYKVVPGVHHPFYTEVRIYLPLSSNLSPSTAQWESALVVRSQIF